MNDQLRNRIYKLSSEELKLAYLKVYGTLDVGKNQKNNESSKRLVAYIQSKPDFSFEDIQIKLSNQISLDNYRYRRGTCRCSSAAAS